MDIVEPISVDEHTLTAQGIDRRRHIFDARREFGVVVDTNVSSGLMLPLVATVAVLGAGAWTLIRWLS
jgi:hypothetical protein